MTDGVTQLVRKKHLFLKASKSNDFLKMAPEETAAVNYELNILLLKIAREMSMDDLRTMKSIMQGKVYCNGFYFFLELPD